MNNNEIVKQNGNDTQSIHFTLTLEQYKKLRKIKEENFIKIIYIIRLGILFALCNEDKLIKRNDEGYSVRNAKHYRVTLNNEIYEQLVKLSARHKMSKSKVIRIGLNELLKNF